jgi:hypothetical protein
MQVTTYTASDYLRLYAREAEIDAQEYRSQGHEQVAMYCDGRADAFKLALHIVETEAGR